MELTKTQNTKAQTHKHNYRNTNTNIQTLIYKRKNIQTDAAMPTQTSKEHLHMVYCEMHLYLSIRYWGIILSGQSVV